MDYIGTMKKQGSIVEVLQEQILSGAIPSGTELTQKEIAEALGVSRMPVREALIILEYQGLLERLPNNHVRVASFSEDYFRKIFTVCRDLEVEVLWEQGLDEAFEVQSEMAFHRMIQGKWNHCFFQKTFETILETYLSFAVNHLTDNGAQRMAWLKEVTDKIKAHSIEKDTLQEEFSQYFKGLEQAFLCMED